MRVHDYLTEWIIEARRVFRINREILNEAQDCRQIRWMYTVLRLLHTYQSNECRVFQKNTQCQKSQGPFREGTRRELKPAALTQEQREHFANLVHFYGKAFHSDTGKIGEPSGDPRVDRIAVRTLLAGLIFGRNPVQRRG